MNPQDIKAIRKSDCQKEEVIENGAITVNYYLPRTVFFTEIIVPEDKVAQIDAEKASAEASIIESQALIAKLEKEKADFIEQLPAIEATKPVEEPEEDTNEEIIP